MVHPAGEGRDNARHRELEEQGRELSDGDAGLYTEDVQLQVVDLLELLHDSRLLWREAWEEISLDSIG